MHFFKKALLSTLLAGSFGAFVPVYAVDGETLPLTSPAVLLYEAASPPPAVQEAQPSVQDEASHQEALQEGAQFPVEIDSTLSSKTAQIGDPVEAHLTGDLNIGDHLIAPKGSHVRGHVVSVEKGRKVLRAELSRHRWLKSAGELGIQFDEIITDNQEHYPLLAKPARQARFVKDNEEGRVLGINNKGEIVSPLSTQVKSQAVHWGVHIAVSAGGVAGGPIGLGAMPVALGCLGAVSPSFAYMHPVGKNVSHRRIKGFALGFISGLPGGGIVCDAIVRGPEAIIKPGDHFEAEFQQEFTGEPSLMAAGELSDFTNTVHGIVLPPEGKIAALDTL